MQQPDESTPRRTVSPLYDSLNENKKRRGIETLFKEMIANDFYN